MAPEASLAQPPTAVRGRPLRSAVRWGSLGLVLIGGWYFLCATLVPWATGKDIDRFVLSSRDSADQIATNLARNLQDETRRLENLPELLTDDVLLRGPLLDHDGKPDLIAQGAQLEAADVRLHQLADLLELDIVYLLDAKGLCVAASNYQTQGSLVGVDVHQRQYYQAIENGGRGRNFAFGTATGVPGLYFSAAIRRDGKFYGGVVVKRAMRGLFRLTTRNAALLVDEYGVVVASTIESTLWHYLPDSAAAGLGGDFLQERYHHAALSAIDLRADQGVSPASLVTLPPDRVPSLMTSRPVGDSGLRLVYFTPLPDLVAMRSRAELVLWLVFGAGGLMLSLLIGAMFYALQSRGRLVALRDSNGTLTLLSEALAAEKATAQAADRAKSRFLASMSHELRTPFSGILGMVDMLRASDLPPLALEQVGLLERSARALLGLLNDILDFSTIDEGQLRVDIVPCDLQPVLHDLGEFQRIVASAKGISLTIEGAEQPLIGLLDPNRFRQIIDNFLSNALKFTALGGVQVLIRIIQPTGERRLLVRVTDSGPGIPLDDRDQLFRPFFQTDSSSTRKHGGTGLGLAISRRLAQAMGGEVGVDSEPGHGATFWVDIPFPATDQPPLAPAGAASGDFRDMIAVPGRALFILLADDDEVNRLVLGGMLRRVGHRVVFAVDGRQAVREVNQLEFDLIIMDMHMPEMDGIAATRAIRTMQDDKASLPIIGLTADALRENRDRYLSAGLSELLTKPISAADLIAAVRRYA